VDRWGVRATKLLRIVGRIAALATALGALSGASPSEPAEWLLQVDDAPFTISAGGYADPFATRLSLYATGSAAVAVRVLDFRWAGVLESDQPRDCTDPSDPTNKRVLETATIRQRLTTTYDTADVPFAADGLFTTPIKPLVAVEWPSMVKPFTNAQCLNLNDPSNFPRPFTIPGQGTATGRVAPTGKTSLSVTWTFAMVTATGTFTGAGVVQTVSVSGSAAPSSPAFDVGIGCGEDGVTLRCTASVFDPPKDADLRYEWRIDGAVQGSSSSTLEVDLDRAQLAAGEHGIAVDVTDRVSGAHGRRSQSMTTSPVFRVTPPSCSYVDDRGSYELRCSTAALEPPVGASVVFDWNVDGHAFQASESMTRTVDQGVVSVGVSARDQVTGRSTRIKTTTVLVNPVGVITNLLTGGQTSDPANVVDEIVGSALGAAALAAGAAVAGAAGALGGLVSRGASGPGGGTSSGSSGASGASSPSGASGGPSPADVGQGAADLLSTEAGDLPPMSAEHRQQWRDLSGWPPGPAGDRYFNEAVSRAWAMKLEGTALLDYLRGQAHEAWAHVRPGRGP
jgi:hypothetical protein